MHLSALLSVISAAAVMAATNEPCVGSGSNPGVCITTTACSSAGGVSITGACPRDPSNVRCCTKPVCANGASGNCRWQSDCAGTSISGQCPGPAQMRCCNSVQAGFGGYATPSIPAVGGCKAVAVNGARALVNAWAGRVREIGCTRSCSDPSSSDHCVGKAIDFMCSDGGGVPTMSGRNLAEWAMNRAAAQNIKYIIWGQRIWFPSEGAKTWTSWNSMEDRGSITQNHWDHVHISYN